MPPKPDLSEWVTKQDAVRLLGVAAKTLERWVDRGRLQKATRRRPGLPPVTVYHPAELERMRQEQEPAAFPVPDDGAGDAGKDPAVTAAVQKRISPDVVMQVLAQAFQRQEHVAKLFLTVKEAAEYSGLPQATVRQMMASGKLEYMKTGAGYRIRKADLEKL